MSIWIILIGIVFYVIPTWILVSSLYKEAVKERNTKYYLTLGDVLEYALLTGVSITPMVNLVVIMLVLPSELKDETSDLYKIVNKKRFKIKKKHRKN